VVPTVVLGQTSLRKKLWSDASEATISDAGEESHDARRRALNRWTSIPAGGKTAKDWEMRALGSNTGQR